MAAFANVEMQLSGHVKGIGTVQLGTVMIPVEAEDNGGGNVTLTIDTQDVIDRLQKAFE